MEEPKIQENIDWSEVISLAEEHLQSVGNGTCDDLDDDDHYIYEAVMGAIYGEGVWKYINSKIK